MDEQMIDREKGFCVYEISIPGRDSTSNEIGVTEYVRGRVPSLNHL